MSRITVDEAARLWKEASDDELRALARAARDRWHEPDRATYMIMRIINYTNVCVAQCDYCAFYVLPGQEGGYVLDRGEVFAKIDELLEVGRRPRRLQRRLQPEAPARLLLRPLRGRAGAVRRPGRVLRAHDRGVPLPRRPRGALVRRGRCAPARHRRVHWVTGGGSEILTEDFRRRHAKFKYTVAEYFDGQRAIVESGMRTTATMVIGFDETLEERLEHLQRTRDFQDGCLRDGYDGLFSFLCWTYKPYGTALGGREIEPREYWRHIALSRIFLDNVRHVRTSVLTLNEDAFRALDYGADDFDLPIEDEVTQKAGAHIDLDLERLLEVPRKLGYTVAYRRAERPAAVSRRAIGFARRRRRPAPRAPRAATRRRGSPARASRSRGRPRGSARGRRSQRPATSTPSSGPPAIAARTTSSSRAARRSGSVGVPSRRSVPGTFPVWIVSPAQSRMSSTIWNATPSSRP